MTSSSCDLPRLPVPALEQTMRLYLEAVEVIVDDEEQLKRTRSYVEEFMRPDGIGAKLQQLLIEKQQREDNWAYDWWLDDMYMDNPIALPVNSNPGMVFPQRQIPKNDLEAFLADIAALVNAVLDQKDLIEMYQSNGP